MTQPDIETQSSHVLLKHYPGSALLHVTGSDAHKWLHGIVTADLNTLADHAFWGLMLHRNGKVRCEVVGLAQNGEIWLAVIGGDANEVYEYLDSLILMDDVEVTLVQDRSLWAIHATSSESPLAAANQNLPVVCRGSLRWFGERDEVFVVAGEQRQPWLNDLREMGLSPCADEAWQWLRIRSGVPLWAVDYSSQDTPHHAGLFSRAVAERKGCYIGQEVVCKVEMIGHVSSRSTRVELESLVGIEVGASVQVAQTGESVGVVTSFIANGSAPGGWAMARLKSTAIEKQAAVCIGDSQGRIVDMLRA